MADDDDFDLSALLKKNLNVDSAVIFGDDDTDEFTTTTLPSSHAQQGGGRPYFPPPSPPPPPARSNAIVSAVGGGGDGTAKPIDRAASGGALGVMRRDAKGNSQYKIGSDDLNSARLTKEMQNLFGDVKNGMLPFDAIPKGMVEYFLSRIKRWERIEQRPPELVTPKTLTATPPRDVVQAFINYAPTGYKLPKKKRGVGLQNHDKLNIRVLLEPKSYKLELCFNMCNTDIGRIPYQRKMQDWTPVDWAWFVAVFFRRVDKIAGHVSLSYKLMTKPDREPTDSSALVVKGPAAAADAKVPKKKFAHEIELAFYDLQSSYFLGNEVILNDSEDVLIGFGVPGDESDILADISWAFDDEKTLGWIKALGFSIEDRSDHAARSYYGAGSTDVVVIDHLGKKYTGHKNYIEARLADCCDSSIEKSEVDMRKTFILDHVLCQQADKLYTRWFPSNELTEEMLWDRYSTFKRKTLFSTKLLHDSIKVGGSSSNGNGISSNSSARNEMAITDRSNELDSGATPGSKPLVSGVPIIPNNPLLMQSLTAIPTITAMQAVATATTAPTRTPNAKCCVFCTTVEGERNPAGILIQKLMMCTCKMPAFRYCSKECQKADWKNHKIVCKMHTHKLLR